MTAVRTHREQGTEPQRPASAVTAIATPSVKLADVVFALETQTESCNTYIDLVTGEIHVITLDDEMAIDDDDEKIPEWQRPTVRIARAIENGEGAFLSLPTRADIHEYGLIERFSAEQTDAGIRDTLLTSIRGSGAFRRFRDALRSLCLLEEWERYRMRALEEIAIEWCDRHGIAYDPTDVPWLDAGSVVDAPARYRAFAENATRLFNEPVYTHVTWRAKPGREQEFIDAWNALGDLFSALEQPPIEVTLIRRADDGTLFQSIGSWRSLEDAQAVSDSPAAMDALANIARLCDEGMPSVYEVVRRVRPE